MKPPSVKSVRCAIYTRTADSQITRLTKGLTEEQAQQIKDELTTAATRSSASQPAAAHAKVRKLRNRLGRRKAKGE
jgi:NifU-like protein involved in Fe-S cluster formation